MTSKIKQRYENASFTTALGITLDVSVWGTPVYRTRRPNSPVIDVDGSSANWSVCLGGAGVTILSSRNCNKVTEAKRVLAAIKVTEDEGNKVIDLIRVCRAKIKLKPFDFIEKAKSNTRA